MSEKQRPVRGMNDILPEAAGTWHYLESVVREIVTSYGYDEVRLPLLEHTELFKRSIGEATDIVEKEMYTFDDRNGESLTLRPEATACMVRAGISNGWFHNQKKKLWTTGPMFRREKPQQGRYRQFYQFNVEAYGYDGPDVDAEMILMSARLWKRLNISQLRLEINSLGTPTSRDAYREVLVAYFSSVKSKLDEDSIRRLETNPLRILDSKNPQMQEIVAGAPVMLDYLDEESAAHFAELKSLLDAAGIAYTVNSRLVRGLDYYSRTVFEWVTDALGSQGAVCSGGRYDSLIETLGGRATPAIGWAMGIERFVALYEVSGGQSPGLQADVFVTALGSGTLACAVTVAEALRDKLPATRVEVNFGGGSFKAQMKRADKSGAQFALVLGEQELADGTIGIKPLRSDAEQETVDRTQLNQIMMNKLQLKAS